MWLLITIAVLTIAAMQLASANLLTTHVSGDEGAGIAPPSYTGPGDVVSGATAWYGLRAYTAAIAAAHTQALINIRNTATSETCDVIVATNGGFGNVANCSGSSSGDTVAVFCAESAGSCAITEIYDQSGNGFNATQPTAGDQPLLVLSCIGSLPCAQFTSDVMTVASGAITMASPMTFSTVANRTGSTAAFGAMSQFGNLTVAPGFNASANTVVVFEGGASQFTASATDNATHAFQFTITGDATSVINVDNIQTTGTTGAISSQSKDLYFGGRQGSNNTVIGNQMEVGVWPSTFTTTQQGNMCHNQFTYWGTATSC